MASKGSTWCKKLMARGKKHSLGLKLGTYKPLSLATSQDATVELKKVRTFNAPMVVGYVPKRRGSGCRLSHEKRLLVLERCEKRAAFFAGLGVRV